jgi:ATP-binding cassette subfamily F protein uup
LLTILFRNPNFLILDEPTNDLDLPTLAVVENFLADYQGCVLIVSHDRYFMDRLVDHLFVFEGDGVVRDFPGNYTQYRIEEAYKEKLADQQKSPAKEAFEETTAAITKPARKKLSFKEQREFEQLEKDIAALEVEKHRLTQQLSESLPYEKMQEVSARIVTVTQELEEKEMRWLELSEMAG